MLNHFETLVRSLLIRPDQPAVVILGHFSPQTYKTYGIAGPNQDHNTVAQFYDVPNISIRPVLFNDFINDPNSIKKYFVDPVLANPLGHDLLSDILIAYMQSQVCNAWEVVTGPQYQATHGGGDVHGLFGGVGIRKGVPEPDVAEDAEQDETRTKPDLVTGGSPPGIKVPGSRLKAPPGNRPFKEIAPYCVSANDLINPLPPSLFYGSGWFAFHPTGGANSLQVRSHYWYSTLPTSKLRIPVVVGAGDIGIYYLQEPISEIGEGSAIHCWVDDNYAGAKVIENAAKVSEPTAS